MDSAVVWLLQQDLQNQWGPQQTCFPGETVPVNAVDCKVNLLPFYIDPMFCFSRCTLFHLRRAPSSAAPPATALSPFCPRSSPTNTPTPLSSVSWLRQRPRSCVPLPCRCLSRCPPPPAKLTSSRRARGRSMSTSLPSARSRTNSHPNPSRPQKRPAPLRPLLLEVKIIC